MTVARDDLDSRRRLAPFLVFEGASRRLGELERRSEIMLLPPSDRQSQKLAAQALPLIRLLVAHAAPAQAASRTSVSLWLTSAPPAIAAIGTRSVAMVAMRT